MGHILQLALIAGIIFGLIALFTSSKSDPGERAGEALSAGVGGAIGSLGCLMQAAISAAFLLLGLWVLSSLFASC